MMAGYSEGSGQSVVQAFGVGEKFVRKKFIFIPRKFKNIGEVDNVFTVNYSMQVCQNCFFRMNQGATGFVWNDITWRKGGRRVLTFRSCGTLRRNESV